MDRHELSPPHFDRTNVPVSIGLVLVTLLTYLPALWCDYVRWDDPDYVTDNPAVQAGLVPRSIAYAFTTFDTNNWIPLTWLSYELDSSLFGRNPMGFHATNILFHALNVWLLFLILVRLTAASGRSAVVALFYAIHPLHVESVAWISERKDVLSTFWLLATLLMYERYAREPSHVRMMATGFMMTLGLLAKPMLVTLPILLLLLDFWPLGRVTWLGRNLPWERSKDYPLRPLWKAVLEKVPLFVLALVAGEITLLAQRANMSRESVIPLAVRLGNAAQAYGWYLWKTAVPIDLCAFYPHPVQALSWPVVGLSVGLLLAFSLCVVYWGQARPWILFGWLWFVVTLLPVIGILQVGKQAYADRYVYVPHIGLFIMIVWALDDLLTRFQAGRKCGMVLVLAAAVACISLTRAQIGTWQNTAALWSHALKLDPTNYLAHSVLGVIHFERHEFEAAEREFRDALNSNPHDSVSIYWLGRICYARQEWDQAAQYFSWVLRIDPLHQEAARYYSLVSTKVTSPPTPARIGQVTIKPDPAAVDQVRLGLKYARRQFASTADFESALRHFEAAIQIDPSYAGAYVNAAIACRELGRLEPAIEYLLQAQAREPNRPEHHTDLAQIYELKGQLPQAIDHYETALMLRPTDVETQIRLSRLRRQLSPR